MTTPKDNALHLMEKLAYEHCFKAYEMPPKDAQLYMFDAERLAKLVAAAAPKTAHAHWVDEVEASGEAEKHAAEPVRAYMDCEDCSGTGDTGEPERYMGEFQPPEGERCGSCNGSGQWGGDFYTADQYATLKALYEKSQELFARERGITKEVAEKLRMAARQNSHDMLMTGEEIRQCDLALSKVQHVAARGAEVSE